MAKTEVKEKTVEEKVSSVVEDFLITFAAVFVQESYNILQKQSPMPLQQFYEILSERVSSQMNIPKSKFLHLHHSFHWELFLNKDSSFCLSNSSAINGGYFVAINGVLSKESLDDLVAHITKKYIPPQDNDPATPYLPSRMASYS